MARTYAYSANFDKDIENLFKEAKTIINCYKCIV